MLEKLPPTPHPGGGIPVSGNIFCGKKYKKRGKRKREKIKKRIEGR
jgi:hypothetical protein